MTAPAEGPRGGEVSCSRGISEAEHWIDGYYSCPAAGRGDTDSGGEAIEPGFIAESNRRRLKWFTDAELAAELARRRALDGT